MNGGELRNDPETWAAQFGIKLSGPELVILRTRKRLLGDADRKLAYRLLLALRPESCPACQWVICERSTWTGPIPMPADTPNDGSGYTCPHCEATLIHHQRHDTPDPHGFELAPDSPSWPVVAEAIDKTGKHM
jgi:hypothetical protein